eukprot:COSAG01_NODE_601_length_14954_cov_175.954359_2_plen_134_part_00
MVDAVVIMPEPACRAARSGAVLEALITDERLGRVRDRDGWLSLWAQPLECRSPGAEAGAEGLDTGVSGDGGGLPSSVAVGAQLLEEIDPPDEPAEDGAAWREGEAAAAAAVSAACHAMPSPPRMLSDPQQALR